MRLYKIQRESDGLFSTGGSFPRFHKTGKSWEGPAQLVNHLALFKKTRRDVYDGCKLVTFELVPVDVKDEKLTIEKIFYEYSLQETKAKLAGNEYW
jgi:hypothetical protein